MKESITRITTADTKKTYEFPGQYNPSLFEVSIRIVPVQDSGNTYDINNCTHVYRTVYLELVTLLKAGLKPYDRKPLDTDPEPTETVENLIIRLLEHVGYYPCKHG